MKLSIILITYNQEKFIQECMDGLLIQIFPDDYEVIVADDFSTDKTLDIIKENFNEKSINYHILPTIQNLGIAKNYKRAYQACQGEYIAILEGDDYWINRNHLVNHISFLDNHSECVLSFNRLILLHEENSKFDSKEWENNKEYKYITSNEMALGNKIGNLSACIFRRSILKKMEESLFDMGFADWFLGLFLGQYGLLAKQKKITSIYRIHNKGVWSGNNNNLKQKMSNIIDEYNKLLDYKYNSEFLILKRKYNIFAKINIINIYKVIKLFLPPIIIIIIKFLIPIKFLRIINPNIKK